MFEILQENLWPEILDSLIMANTSISEANFFPPATPSSLGLSSVSLPMVYELSEICFFWLETESTRLLASDKWETLLLN